MKCHIEQKSHKWAEAPEICLEILKKTCGLAKESKGFTEWSLLRSAQYRDSFDGYDVSHVSGCDLLNGANNHILRINVMCKTERY